MLSERENYIRTVRMTDPERIPCTVHLSDATWHELGRDLEQVCDRHPHFFPWYRKGARDFTTWQPAQRAGTTTTDAWGCVWDYGYDGLMGQAATHPLDDWAKFDGFQAPDPEQTDDTGRPYDWDRLRLDAARAKEQGRPALAGLPHGYFLMRLWDLRGFENLMLDIASAEPRLRDLIDLLVRRNNVIVRHFIEAGVDAIHFGEDLGTQTASILSPRDFREWVLPAYKRMMAPVRDAGIIVDTHSDGCIIELVDLLLECGCDVLNPQDLCNGIDNIARTMKGRCCIKLDVDRQSVVPFGSRKDIHDLIEEEVRKLGSPRGGLEFIAGIYPPTPLENIDALCEALDTFRTYWWT